MSYVSLCDRLTIRRNKKYGHVVDIVVFASGDRKKGGRNEGEKRKFGSHRHKLSSGGRGGNACDRDAGMRGVKEIEGSSSDHLVLKVLECWVFISVHLHASNVSLFR